MKIAYATGEKNGASFYRLEQPLRLLAEKGKAFVLEMNSANIDMCAEADIFIIPALYSNPEKCAFLKDGKSKVVLDLWDDPFEISPWSPSYGTWGIEAVNVNTPDGRVIELWKDGERGFEIEKNFDRRQDLKRFLEFADLVTVTTQRLGERIFEHCKAVRVLPDCIDFRRWRRLPLAGHSDVRLYWGGGTSHYPDLRTLEAPLQKVMEANKDTTLTLMGTNFAGGALKLKGMEGRALFENWVNSCCYPLKVAAMGIDIGLIPLLGNRFDECKSPLKWAELSALCIPSIVSDVPPYTDVYDGDNMALVAGNNWEEAISTLIKDSELRSRIGMAGYETVRDKFDAEKNVVLWEKAYSEVMNGN